MAMKFRVRRVERKFHKLVQFFCPGCGAWLYDDGTVHGEDEHDGDTRRVDTWRGSDDGTLWLPCGPAGEVGGD